MKKKNKSVIEIVEDEQAVVNILRDKLEKEGFAVLEARNGAEGLELAKRKHPDLVLLDIIMPVMDGITMLKKLREDGWGKTVPVIILTNLSDAESVAEATEKGAFDFLVKSNWKLVDIVKKVKERV